MSQIIREKLHEAMTMHKPYFIHNTAQPWWFVEYVVKELRFQLNQVACAQTAQNAETYEKVMKGSALYGHCAAVAFNVHDLFGGKYFSVMINGQSHWFNQCLGWDIDLAGDQFGFNEVQVVDPGILYNEQKYQRRERKPEELNEETKQRARLLRRRWMNRMLITST